MTRRADEPEDPQAGVEDPSVLGAGSGPAPMPHPRDVTRALQSVEQAQALIQEVVDVLRDAADTLLKIDARTTSRDPSVVAHERDIADEEADEAEDAPDAVEENGYNAT